MFLNTISKREFKRNYLIIKKAPTNIIRSKTFVSLILIRAFPVSTSDTVTLIISEGGVYTLILPKLQEINNPSITNKINPILAAFIY